MALAGLELLTGAGALGLRRLTGNTRALVTGMPGTYPAARLQVGLGLLSLGLLLAATLWGIGLASRRIRGHGKVCPDCGALTKRLRRTRVQRFLGSMLHQEIARRRCEFCGWIGLSVRL